MAVALWGCTGVLQAKVVLPSVFTDNMVLQQKRISRFMEMQQRINS